MLFLSCCATINALSALHSLMLRTGTKTSCFLFQYFMEAISEKLNRPPKRNLIFIDIDKSLIEFGAFVSDEVT